MTLLRVGQIEFINSLPIDLGFFHLSKRLDADVDVVSGTPTVLNEKILKGKLDVSPVSALFYAEHQDDLLILPDLSISSLGAAQSVLLLTRYLPQRLKKKTISVTRKGRTTPGLLQILCRLKYGFEPQLRVVDGFKPEIMIRQSDAALVIGDDALLARERFAKSRYKIVDLAQEWSSWTNLPLVFALWVVRKDFFEANSELVVELHKTLLESKRWGIQNHEAVLNAAEKKIALPRPILESYFSCLTYDLGENLKQGMHLYFEKAVECGILENNPMSSPNVFIGDQALVDSR
ncbi:MAG: menaquinone biosynthesis protein [Candidatus Omnitrophica bacterium]|nr:menaquinone biosynthesis protein [Candidatus Omnitrophota bacterium]